MRLPSLPDQPRSAPVAGLPGRRRALQRLGLAAGSGLLWQLSGCASPGLVPLAGQPASDPRAEQWLLESAQAHGLAGWAQVRDLNLTYRGEWRALVNRLQPELVDADYRGRSEERLLPAAGLIAQQHFGPTGRKQVLRRGGSAALNPADSGQVEVHYNGRPTTQAAQLDAAALVADGYRLFLLGPLALHGRAGLQLRVDEPEEVNGHPCDSLSVRLAPGLGRSPQDTLRLFIDRRERLMRRLRFSLDGLESTRGAVAEVDTFDHLDRHGVRWPTRFHERLRAPIPGLPVHDWQLTGLDINRGWSEADVAGLAWQGVALMPAVLI